MEFRPSLDDNAPPGAVSPAGLSAAPISSSSLAGIASPSPSTPLSASTAAAAATGAVLSSLSAAAGGGGGGGGVVGGLAAATPSIASSLLSPLVPAISLSPVRASGGFLDEDDEHVVQEADSSSSDESVGPSTPGLEIGGCFVCVYVCLRVFTCVCVCVCVCVFRLQYVQLFRSALFL